MRTVPLFVRIGRLRHHAVAEGLRHGGRAGNLVGGKRSRQRRGEHVQLARVGHARERGCRHAEVLGQHLGWNVLQPVAEEEGVVLVEIAVVEHQQELGAVGAEALDRMGNAGREIPQVAHADVVDEIAPVLVDGRDARAAVEHVGPLGGLVPVQLAHAAGVEAHVHAGDVLGDAELAHRDLARPATGIQPHVRVIEGEAQVGQRAVVGSGRRVEVRVLQVAGQVARAGIGAAAPRQDRLRQVLGSLGAGCCGSGRSNTGGSRQEPATRLRAHV